MGHHQSDHTALLHLSDATLLANSKERYALDEIYTFVGPILVAINPFKYIERLYTPDLMAKAKKYAVGHPDRPAHTFSMAEAAYMQLIKQKKPIRYVGVIGPVQFDKNGDIAGPFRTWKIADGEVVTAGQISTEDVQAIQAKMVK